jgi:hypothetical protein
MAKLWAEEVNCGCFLENLMVKKSGMPPALEAWSGEKTTQWFNRLVQFGQVGNGAKKSRVSKFKSNRGKLLNGETMNKEINMIEMLEIEMTRRENVWSCLE